MRWDQSLRVRGALPPDFPLTPGDLVLLVRRHLAPHFAVPLGGSGGGVQVLDATEARGRSFEALFVVGLARDVFPRSVREDPLLPDPLRERVRDVLPEIPEEVTTRSASSASCRLGSTSRSWLLAGRGTVPARASSSGCDGAEPREGQRREIRVARAPAGATQRSA
jgi:hypothetical protein